MRRLFISLLAGLLVAACAPLPPSPEDFEAKRFAAVADKAVVYLYRQDPDFSEVPATFMLDDQLRGTTYQGTFYRIELPPGRHRIAGFAGDAGRLDFDAQPGRLYFIRQSVTRFTGFHQSFFHFVGEAQGRAGVLRAQLLGAR